MNSKEFIKNIKYWNWISYKNDHIDLKNLSEDILLQHVLKHGLNEDRNIIIDENNTSIISRKTIENNISLLLPEDFNSREYINLYNDLKYLSEDDAIYHYVLHGNSEGRNYRNYKVAQEKINNNEKVLIINPIFGLGNRLRAIASAYSISKHKNMKLVINWIPDYHCDCLIEDLIVNIHNYGEVIYNQIDNESLIDFELYNYLEVDEEGKKDEYINDNYNKIYVKSNCLLNNEYSYIYFYEFLQSLKWNDYINNLIISIPDIYNYIGMHIRMEGGNEYQNIDADKSSNWTERETELMFKYREISHIDNFINKINEILHENPEKKFFIATDMKCNYDKLINIYGHDKIKILERNDFDRSKEQLYYAVSDMILLSRCNQFYGSIWSSFSELVTYFQKDEVKKSNIFSNDFKKYDNNNISNFISVCYACKNRHNSLIQSINSIISNDKINDIVVVDWNTDEINLYELLKAEIQTNYFWKINYIKITNNVPWILTYAFNISFIYAKNNNIIKSDCDYIFSNKFIEVLSKYDIQESFYSFDYNNAITENQRHLNGFFYISKNILKKSSFFNNNIMFYGYDDCYLKECFEKAGFTYNRLTIDDNDLYHLKGTDQERVKNQKIYDNSISNISKIINFFGYDIKNLKSVGPLILYNKIMCELYPNTTTEKDVWNLLSSKKVSHRYAEYSLCLNNIQNYDTDCNHLFTEKSICRYEIFSKMKEQSYWWHDSKNHYGNIIINIENKYEIVNIKNKINLFMFFYNVNIEKKKNNNHLVISLYNESNINRSIELLYCLRENLNNESITKIHILMENSDKSDYFLLECINELIFTFGGENNLKIIPINRRPNFNDYFEYINKNIKGNAIIANSDIVYDNTINKIENILENEFIVLTRYQKYNDTFKLLHYNDTNPEMSNIFDKANIFSQDTWIFKSPMYDNIDIPMFVGSMFSDSYINYRLNRSKYTVYNKSKFINSYHIQNESSLSESISGEKRDKEWEKLHELVNYETTDFICGVPLQDENGFQEEIINWQQFWHTESYYLID